MVSFRFLFELQMYVHVYLEQGNTIGIRMYLQFWMLRYFNFFSTVIYAFYKIIHVLYKGMLESKNFS